MPADQFDMKHACQCFSGNLSVLVRSLGHSNPSLALSSNCPACLADEYQDEIGQAHCKKCPAGSDSSLSTLRSKRSDCICKPLHHGTPGSECPPCPKPIIEFVHDSENMTAAMDPWSRCDTYDQRWPLPLAGYWLNVQRDKAGVVQVRQCVKPESCLEMKLNESESENEEIMLRISKGWTCATGYTGEACAMCCEGDEEDPSCPGAYYRLNGVCMVCPEGNSGFMIGAMIVIGLFAPAIFAATDKMPALPSLDIGLTFAQVTATFPGRDLNWPASVKRVMDACSVFSFNVEMVHPECNLKVLSYPTMPQ
ncbi:hypothetical protein CYMTET_13153 [Cymbomonas tetramitiformis]|uniref:Tyrosine-protein kinase ephrin type A/B receptor-like domain-containing protein n=1 Tax=Cymbomonas tetramitiformis TaxID=36881 RepID=A0AAE0LBR7_9CHLO|nr:hypothetical protein CYMTET_13153 [Cymbomonas tetramitiformis]